jgi:hypothetical protein
LAAVSAHSGTAGVRPPASGKLKNVTVPDNPFPAAFFDRADPSPDTGFYATPRMVTHIDGGAIAAVRDLYAELGLDGGSAEHRRVLDLMSSWTSHLRSAPAQ